MNQTPAHPAKAGRQVRHVVFDFGGVIFRLRDVAEPIRRFRQLGFADADRYLGIYGQSGLFLQIETGEIDDRRFVELLSEKCGRDLTYEEVTWAWMGYVRDVPPAGLSMLRRLREAGYDLSILSNTNRFIQRWARSDAFSGDGHDVFHYVHRIYCSDELKSYKPDPEIFRKAMALGGMNPEETLFLDDSEKNIRGAEAVGIEGILVPPDANWMPLLAQRLGIAP